MVKNKFITLIILAVFMTTSINTMSCKSSSPTFNNPPIEVCSAKWLLGPYEDDSLLDFSAKWSLNQAIDGSPWIYLELIINNISGRDIQNVLYCRHYCAWYQTEHGIHMTTTDAQGGDMLKTKNIVKAGDTVTLRIPIQSWELVDWINQSRYFIEKMSDSYIVIYWAKYRGFGSWGYKATSLDDMDFVGALKVEISDWNYVNASLIS